MEPRSSRKLEFLRFLCVVAIASNSWLMTSHTTWKWMLGCLVLGVVLVISQDASIGIETIRRVPYSWQCQRCRSRGLPVRFEGSEASLIQQLKDNHNRHVHLEEV